MRRAILAAVFLVGCAGEPMNGDECEEGRAIVCGTSPRAEEEGATAALRCDPVKLRLYAVALCGECESDGTSEYRCDGRLQAWHEDPCEGEATACADADSVLRCVGGAWQSEVCGAGRSCSTVTDSATCL